MRKLLLGLLAASAALATGLPASGSSGAVNGRIAYERHGFFGGPEVWTMNQDGTDPRRVGPGSDPAWSPDGAWLVVVDQGMLVVLRSDGSDARVLEVTGGPTDGDRRPYPLHSPAWAPDGTAIAFGGHDGLYVVSSAGGAAHRLASGVEPGPAWSPDGDQIAFIAQGGAVSVVNADGSGLRALPGARGYPDRSVSWSPDGSRIVFEESGSGAISSVRLDGAVPVVLIPPGLGQSDPAWSPDGTRIAFVGNNMDVCVANADGTGLGRLTYGAADEDTGSQASSADPAWQPLASGSAAAGPPAARPGPPADWERRYSWTEACSHQYAGRKLTGIVTPARVRLGGLVTYRLRLANRGGVPVGQTYMAAFGAVLDGGARIMSLAASRGDCRAEQQYLGRPTDLVNCRFGSLFPGEAVTVTVRVRATTPGEITLRASLPRPSLPCPGPAECNPTVKADLLTRTRVAGCTVRGTQRSDAIAGSTRADVLCGLEGDDRIRAGRGSDIVSAGPDDDRILVRDGVRDRVWCGSGEDSVVADRHDLVERDCEHTRRR